MLENSVKMASVDPCDSELRFLLTVGECKSTPRQGWVEHNIPHPESVSAHMHRMSILCMMVPDTTLDKNRMIQMALCHDIGEAIIGDVTPRMRVSSAVKHASEHKAVQDMTALVPNDTGSVMLQLWEEFEEQKTPEALFVRDMDYLEMVIQAYRYECQGHKVDGFFPVVERLRHPWARALGERVLTLRKVPAAEKVQPLPKHVLESSDS